MRALTLVLSLGLAATSGCATSPTGRKQIMLLPETQMAQLGAQSFQQLKQQEKVSSDPQVNAYVQCVADAITRELPSKHDWEVRVFESEDVNAFALPGGKIGVYTGILDVAKNQDQLATVIGHEVAHVVARHGNERVSQGLLIQGGLSAADVVMRDVRQRNIILAALGLGATVGVALPHSRTQESEADDVGLDLMAKAGFDPTQSDDLWRNMSKASAGKQPPEWLSTHPAHRTRIQDLNREMKRAEQLADRAQAAGKRPECGALAGYIEEEPARERTTRR